MALVLSVAIASILAFATALPIWLVSGPGRVPFQMLLHELPQLLVRIIIICISACGVALIIASLFVLTPHASAYEALLLMPLFLISDIFGIPGGPIGTLMMWASPTMRILAATLEPTLTGSARPISWGVCSAHRVRQILLYGDSLWQSS